VVEVEPVAVYAQVVEPAFAAEHTASAVLDLMVAVSAVAPHCKVIVSPVIPVVFVFGQDPSEMSAHPAPMDPAVEDSVQPPVPLPPLTTAVEGGAKNVTDSVDAVVPVGM